MEYYYETNFHKADPKPGEQRQMAKSTYRIHAPAKAGYIFSLKRVQSHSI